MYFTNRAKFAHIASTKTEIFIALSTSILILYRRKVCLFQRANIRKYWLELKNYFSIGQPIYQERVQTIFFQINECEIAGHRLLRKKNFTNDFSLHISIIHIYTICFISSYIYFKKKSFSVSKEVERFEAKCFGIEFILNARILYTRCIKCVIQT